MKLKDRHYYIAKVLEFLGMLAVSSVFVFGMMLLLVLYA